MASTRRATLWRLGPKIHLLEIDDAGARQIVREDPKIRGDPLCGFGESFSALIAIVSIWGARRPSRPEDPKWPPKKGPTYGD